MTAVRFTLETSVAAEHILAAATDFSERRPDLWPNISRRFYKVHEVGDTWAEVTEGSDNMGGIWARERYEWSTPGTVTGTVQESNIFQPGGTWEIRVRPTAHGASSVELVRDRKGKSLKGKVLETMLAIAGRKILLKALQPTLDILAQEEKLTARPTAVRGGIEETQPGMEAGAGRGELGGRGAGRGCQRDPARTRRSLRHSSPGAAHELYRRMAGAAR
jgi:hypothetical protein